MLEGQVYGEGAGGGGLDKQVVRAGARGGGGIRKVRYLWEWRGIKGGS